MDSDIYGATDISINELHYSKGHTPPILRGHSKNILYFLGLQVLLPIFETLCVKTVCVRCRELASEVTGRTQVCTNSLQGP